ncbi:hypothetical protein CK203_097320 [Vitis vinifera]|uniref:Uncharacterized protein n=1 Tax=Vitis vinifera TaxID=29760 RepID=A0A438D6A6_VITVI|nr:hypothetical protein CK203_097320 [Vitis vinifera]
MVGWLRLGRRMGIEAIEALVSQDILTSRNKRESIGNLSGIYWVDIALSWVRNGRKCGGLLPCACGGLFGRKGTEGLLMMLSNLTK